MSYELLPTVRSPTVMLLVNGEPVSGVVRAAITSNNHFGADCFSVTIATGSGPIPPALAWSRQENLLLELRFSLDGLAFVSLIQGAVDGVIAEPLAGLLRLEGRDLSAALIETRTQETFSNRTSSEIAALLAARHGLAAVVAPTTTPVGRYYQSEHDRITLNQFSRATTEWDLLVYLARREGFDLFVRGTTLYFQPGSQAPLEMTPIQPADLVDLRLRRSLTLARDIEVTVKSWNSRLQHAFSQTARASNMRGGGFGAPQRYVLVRPNLTPDQALKLAQQTLAELTAHERVIEFTMPGELSLTPRSILGLYGTASDFDQQYFIDTIEREIHPDRGFIQHVRAKNSSPRSDSTPQADEVGSVTGT